MDIKLNIEYYPNEGEELFADILEDCGNGSDSVPMSYTGNGRWQAEIKYTGKAPFRYRYIVKKEGAILRKEWGSGRTIIDAGKTTVCNYDSWMDLPKNSYAYTSPFGIVFGRPCNDNVKKGDSLTFMLYAPNLPEDLSVAVTGNFLDEKWSVKDAVKLKFQHYPLWEVSLPLKGLPQNIEYKYMITDRKTGEFRFWENGGNRRFYLPDYNPGREVDITGDVLRCEFPDWQSAGVVIPLFSLRSGRSWGIGDISDLKPAAEWAKGAGMRFVQLLPINDTTNMRDWRDSYPYSANSSFALHPAYLDVVRAGRLSDVNKMNRYLSEASALNNLACIDYGKVIALKESYLRELYEESGYAALEGEEYLLFAEANKSWLQPYTAYSYLRDTYGTSDFTKWGEYSVYNPAKVSGLTAKSSPAYKEVGYYGFLQYHLHKQMSEAREYAHNLGVMFKGDIPIGVNRNSADVWRNPELFDCDSQAGAPPDDFAMDGQNWGFPTYRWDVMQKNGYAWWCARLNSMAQYFDAYRIDHILGFFRIWSIPSDTISGLLGHFVPALPLSAEEIKSAGFDFNRERDTRPYVTDTIISDVFGKYAAEAKDNLFTERAENGYSVKERYSSQRKALDNIGQRGAKGDALRAGMMSILTDVLFVEDGQKKGYYHPRIEAAKSNSYKALTKEQREVFDCIYKDFYFHRHNGFWKDQAMKKLPALISATDMLVCGEDLGMIPASVPEVMDKLQILSLEVERMPKKPYTVIADVNSYPYLSVCTTSTHDMSGLRLWWRENPGTAQYYYNEILKCEGKAPIDATPEICREIVARHFNSPSMLAILPLQDILAIDAALRRKDPADERINDPSDKDNYWRYRMHLNLEELILNTEFTQKIKKLVTEGGRTK